ncbi:MAG: NADH-quinone oxidoreductase subunit I [Chrysiogenetes bacterium]|nr:NADH-quinone oxidoreductase subunit I [Chrysiogenetes bacterium]
METQPTENEPQGVTATYGYRPQDGSPVQRYWRSLFGGISSVFEAFTITMGHMFRTPVTVQYPEVNVKAQLPERYRGFLNVDLDVCISCRNCEKACPIDCILIEDVKLERKSIIGNNGKPSKKLLNPTVFNIDLSKCMWCGLCVEPCPTGAIYFTREFERSTSNIRDLYFEFVTPDERKALKEKAKKFAEKEAKAKAEKAAALAAKKAAEEAAQAEGGGSEDSAAPSGENN